MKKIIEEIRNKGFVPYTVRISFFKNLSLIEVRDWLESHGLNRHLPLQLHTTEIAIITPAGILMQVRPCDNNQLGMWGGALEPGETPVEGAIRELYEETHLKISEKDLDFIDTYEHTHRYANGDKAQNKTYRFVLNLNYVPNITINSESKGFKLIAFRKDAKKILSQQRSFIMKLISK